jgi:hypothetical protein
LSGRYSRRKGHDFERRVAKDLREIGYEDARRGLQSQGGEEMPPDVIAPPFAIQCKNHAKKVHYRKAMEQAEGECPKGHYPVVVVKEGRQKPLVIMTYEDWLDLVRQMKEMEES